MATPTQHTPGPWKMGVRQPNSYKFIYGREGEEVANCDRLTNFPDENLGNARLIAAAPELLAACEVALADLTKTVNFEEGDEHTVATCNLLDQVITKAKTQP